jgi:hypothetical protein
MPEKLAIFAPAQTMYVYAANFLEHKEGREKESEEGQAPSLVLREPDCLAGG